MKFNVKTQTKMGLFQLFTSIRTVSFCSV